MPDNSKAKHQRTRVTKDIEDIFVLQVCQQFEAYLLKREYNPKTAHNYARDLHHSEIEPFMLKTYGCRSVYWLTDDDDLLHLLTNYHSRGINVSMDGRVKNATMRYREFLSEDNHRYEMETLALSIERELEFRDYLDARGIRDSGIMTYVATLKAPKIADTMQKSFGCPTIFGLNNSESVKRAMALFSTASVNQHNIFRSACNKYCDWINDSEGGYEEDSDRRMQEAEKSIELMQFEEMCDIAMHQNIIDAYNYHTMECMKDTGRRYTSLNEGRDYDYWKNYLKETVAYLYSEPYKELSEHFLEFFRMDDRFYSDRVARAIMQYAPGVKGWTYWQTLARWKVAERVLKDGYGWAEYSEEWYAGQPFDLKAAMEISNIERDFGVYKPVERKKCADSLKAQIMAADKKTQNKNMSTTQKLSNFFTELLTEEDYDEREKETTGTLEGMAMTDLFANSDYNAMRDEIKNLKAKLSKALKERDAALEKVAELTDINVKMESENEQFKSIPHDQIVGDVFSEIAQRYMESTKDKNETERGKVRASLNDIMAELKINEYVPSKIRGCINKFNNRDVPPVPHYDIKYEVVFDKHVDYEIGNVASGGTGVNVTGKNRRQ